MRKCNVRAFFSSFAFGTLWPGLKIYLRFSRPNRLGYPHPVSSELERVVSEWRSVLAISLNAGGGVRLIKSAKLYMCTQNTTHTEIICLIWFRTLERWPHKTSTTGTNKNCNSYVPLSQLENIVIRIET